jgi:hypothetical protein
MNLIYHPGLTNNIYWIAVKWHTAFLRIYIIAVVVFLTHGCGNSDRIAQLESQNRELTAKLEFLTKTRSLDLQEQCAKQSREVFKSGKWDKDPLADYTNHYNAKLNKCFIEIQSTDAKTAPPAIFTNKTVSDAFEGKGYGEYMWKSDRVKKYGEVPPLQCKVTLLSGEEKFCHSSDEFDQLIKQYMEQ